MNDFEEKINQAREKIINTMGAEQVEKWLSFYKPNPEYLKFDPTKNISDEGYNRLTREINSKFNYLSSAISQIEEGHIDNYSASDFIKYLVTYQDLLKKRDLIERNQQEKATVKKNFSNYDSYTYDQSSSENKQRGYRAKTVEELEQERNERLAMLGELRASGEINNQQFLEGVISLRRVYEREMQDKQVNDIIEQENGIKKNPSTLRKFTDKLKKLFKIKKGKIAQTSPTQEKNLINRNAKEALIYAYNLLEADSGITLIKPTQSAAGIDVDYQTIYQKERIDLINESIDITSSSFQIDHTNELTDVMCSLYNEESQKCQTEQDKKTLANNILNLGTCYKYRNGRSILKTQEELSDEKN